MFGQFTEKMQLQRRMPRYRGCARTFFTFKATKTQDIIIMIESQSLSTGDDFKELLDITLQHFFPRPS